MRNHSVFVAILALSSLFVSSQNAYPQSPDTDDQKFEVGGQFSILHNSIPNRATFTGIQCVTTPCPSTVILGSRDSQPGFGGRIGYNLTKNVAVEAELNFFPNADSFSVPEAFQGGHKLQGLFGAKVGKRFDKVGAFGKARPGFFYASKGNLQGLAFGACLTIFPTPAACFETTGKSNFALDLGGVVEVYPTKRTIIRFDAGDTIVRLGERNVPLVVSPGGFFVSVIRAPAKTTHNFQGSVGIGFRF
jgi:Outer membrane protein beta-barrel domain